MLNAQLRQHVLQTWPTGAPLVLLLVTFISAEAMSQEHYYLLLMLLNFILFLLKVPPQFVFLFISF